MKSSKQQSKNLAEMSKELEIIALSTNVGVLPEKLEEANNAKNDVEGKLSEKVNDLKYTIGSRLFIRSHLIIIIYNI